MLAILVKSVKWHWLFDKIDWFHLCQINFQNLYVTLKIKSLCILNPIPFFLFCLFIFFCSCNMQQQTFSYFQATCKKFYHFCSTRGIALGKRNFSLKYDTNIPRQVGLAGSSAIVTATLKCLMAFFRITEKDIPKEIQPQFIMEVEVAELFINAGLQDRVVQVYEGLVFMDFDKDLMDSQGFGLYENLPVQDLPSFFICYSSNGSDSGRIHSDVRKRFDQGDSEVVDAMKAFAELTKKAKDAIQNKNWPGLAQLMNDNFGLRRSIYGDPCLGADNIKMVEIGRRFGAACKFPGK